MHSIATGIMSGIGFGPWTGAIRLAQGCSLWSREHVPVTLIEQPHVYPWATVLRVPTSDGVACR